MTHTTLMSGMFALNTYGIFYIWSFHDQVTFLTISQIYAYRPIYVFGPIRENF